ncbi:MAG: HK97 family phage prohead protease [Bacteroidales bacterium]|nr:HK97 family phage prohead protease [Bacteroidales bacterium]
MRQLRLKTRTNEVKEDGIVTIAVSAFGNVDHDGDIIEKGAFTKTINENGQRFKHLLNHNQDYLIGCILKAEETNSNLVVESALNLDTQLGRDVFSFYKLYQKHGRTLEHSIGFEDMKRKDADRRRITEAQLWEVSTLYGWGANEKTPLLGLKSMDFKQSSKEAVDFLRDALKMKFSDEILVKYEDSLHLIEKALNSSGKGLVTCPHCGLVFDYDTVEEHTMEKEILETAKWMASSKVESMVREELQKQEPRLREVIQSILSKGIDITKLSNYVHCPKCYERIYRAEIKTEEAEPTQVTPAAKSRQEGTFSLKALGGLMK